MEENTLSLVLSSPPLYFVKKDRKKDRGEVWVSWRKPKEKDQRPRKHDLRGTIEWTGVS